MEDTNEAYNAFMNTYLTLYNRYCPVKKFTSNSKKQKDSWLKRDWRRPVKRKNKLFLEF